MKDEDFAIARLIELKRRAEIGGEIERSSFFSFSELCKISPMLPKEIRNAALEFGGREEAECKCFFFLPSHLGKNDFLEERMFEEHIGCYRIEVLHPNYSSALTHPSVLGSLMGLGIKRGCIGDIYVEEKEAVFFALKEIEHEVLSLDKIGRDSVKISSIHYEDFPIGPHYEEKRITYESNRLDAIIASAFLMSREDAKKYILSGNVFMTNLAIPKADSTVHDGDHISIKGKGKVIFVEETGYSKKGKIVATIKNRRNSKILSKICRDF